MLPKKYSIVITVVLCFLLVLSVQAAVSLEQKSTLGGIISAKDLVVRGAKIKEGQILMCIESINGPAPAVRSNADGTVSEVLVKPGETVRVGQVVAKVIAD